VDKVLDRFPVGVAGHLKWYVYRLIDPRNGETFYVGKGQGDRVFEHAKRALAASEDEKAKELKFQQIEDIRAAGLEVAHVIHRHGIEDENVAFQIEAALIDAYLGLANKMTGHGTNDYGVRHVREIITEYAAEPFEVREPLILISISQSWDDPARNLSGGRIYNAVRGTWIINPMRAMKYKLVLAHNRGLVLGAFRPKKWLPATKANFPWLEKDCPDRIGFEGDPAEEEVARLYERKRVPDEYRPKGAANPVRFIEPSVTQSN
jgi:hypothetical protein